MENDGLHGWKEIMSGESEIVSKQQVEASAMMATEKLSAAISAASRGDWETTFHMGQSLLLPALSAILVMIVSYFVAKYVARIASTPVRRRVDETLGRFIGKLVFNLIIVGALLGVLGSFGVNVTSFAALLGAAGFAIGLAFQGTLSNFAAGVLLLVFRPFKVGDQVIVAGMNGKVNEIDLFTTTLDTPDNRRIIVPNSSIAGSTIENVTFHAHRRIDFVISVGYDCSIDATRASLTRAIESLQDRLVQGAGRGWQVSLQAITAHAVEWSVKAWVAAECNSEVKELLMIAAKRELDQQGLRMPPPQMQIHVAKETSLSSSDAESVDPIRQRPRMRHSA